jgi:hypothetical protein
MSERKSEARVRWVAPSKGGYSGTSKNGAPVPRPATPPKIPATKGKSKESKE